MAVRSLETDASGFPIRSGMLGVSGAVVRGAAETDGCGLIVDEQGSVCVFVVKVMGETRPGSAAAAAAAIGVATRERLPMHELVAGVSRLAAPDCGLTVGLSLMRFSARDARVEILNAGMPAIVQLLPGAALMLYPSRSGPIGSRFAEVHPYELAPLAWGSAWLLTSDGVTGGSLDPAALLRGITASGLQRSAPELAGAEAPRVEAATVALSEASGATEGADRTLVVVSAEPERGSVLELESRS